MSFVHTHLHTQYSLLDGAIKCEELVKRVKELGMPAVAITDHGCLHGVIDFYKQCKKNNIKPIIGVEAYTTLDPDESEEKNRDNYHLVLLAKNQKGYKDLLRLISIANTKNFYYKPRIYMKHLEECGENLIATTACLGSMPSKILREKGEDEAIDSIKYLYSIFKNNLYLEIEENSIPEQIPYNEFLIKTSKKMGIPLTISTDAHYLTKEDFEFHQMMMAMQFRQTLIKYRDSDIMQYGTDYYVKDHDEIKQISDKYNIPEAIPNTLQIANDCNVEIELGKIYAPEFDISKAKDYESFLIWKEKILLKEVEKEMESGISVKLKNSKEYNGTFNFGETSSGK